MILPRPVLRTEPKRGPPLLPLKHHPSPHRPHRMHMRLDQPRNHHPPLRINHPRLLADQLLYLAIAADPDKDASRMTTASAMDDLASRVRVLALQMTRSV